MNLSICFVRELRTGRGFGGREVNLSPYLENKKKKLEKVRRMLRNDFYFLFFFD
jgi:hypothetical protein